MGVQRKVYMVQEFMHNGNLTMALADTERCKELSWYRK